MRVHPAPNKRSIAAVRYGGDGVIHQKKLRRLPHIFSKVLELPFSSDADVAVEEDPSGFKFVVATADLSYQVRAHAVEIYPGVMKVVIRDGRVELEEAMEMDRWRFRLPATTRPMLASAEYADGELVVTVPKGVGEEEEEDGVEGEFGGGIGRLVAVQ